MARLLTWEDALARILARVEPLPAEAVSLAEAAGRIAAQDVESRVDLPPFASSAMDGFAVRSADTPGRLPIGAEIAAGKPSPRSLEAGEVMAIATGGEVPEGADAVIPIEYVAFNGNDVDLPEAVFGANVRPRGGDLRLGEPVVQKGATLGPGQVGALAAAGVPALSCRRRPRAAVLATGTELRRPGESLERGQVYEANGLMLAAQLRSAGAEAELLQSVADDEEAHRLAIARGLEADVLITSGGVSVGPHDLVRKTGADLGVEEVFWGVAVKPGKPVAFGVRNRTLVFGLPGNPVSSFVAFELFVRPAVLALQGSTAPGPPFEPGALGASVRRNPHRDELLRAVRSDGERGPVLAPLPGQESHMIARAAAADSLVLVPRGEDELPDGAPVRFLRLQ